MPHKMSLPVCCCFNSPSPPWTLLTQLAWSLSHHIHAFATTAEEGLGRRLWRIGVMCHAGYEISVPLLTGRQVPPWRHSHRVQCWGCCHTPTAKHGEDSRSNCIIWLNSTWERKTSFRGLIPRRSRWPAGCLTGLRFHTLQSRPPHLPEQRRYEVEEPDSGSDTYQTLKLSIPVQLVPDSILFFLLGGSSWNSLAVI